MRTSVLESRVLATLRSSLYGARRQWPSGVLYMHTTGALLENRKFVLHERPLALPDASHFKVLSEPLPVPACGEVLVRVLVAALSPWQNQRLKDFKNYTVPFAIGELIDCDVLGEVLASQSRFDAVSLMTLPCFKPKAA